MQSSGSANYETSNIALIVSRDHRSGACLRHPNLSQYHAHNLSIDTVRQFKLVAPQIASAPRICRVENGTNADSRCTVQRYLGMSVIISAEKRVEFEQLNL
jgi:hypothetical protein